MTIKKGYKKVRRSRFIRLMIGLLLGVLILLSLCAYTIHRLKQKYDVAYEFNRIIAEYADRLEHYDSARIHYMRALDADPAHPAVWYRLAEVCRKLEDNQMQEKACLQTLAYDPYYASAYTDLIRLYEKENRLDAIFELMQSVKTEEMLPLFMDYQIEDPVYSPKSGEFDCQTLVSFANSDEFEIYYTTDGSDPCEKGMLYTSPILLQEDGIYQFKAVSRNMYGFYSQVVDGAYVIDLAAPEQPHVSPEGGNFAFPTEIYISVPEGCSVYYTWDGSKPDQRSDRYEEPLTVPEGNHVLSVVAIDNATRKQSSVFSGYYVYYVNQ